MNAALILPARDEEACIAAVIEEARRHFVGKVVVVDNGSRDGTASVAAAAGAFVVREPAAGYGRACMAGVAAAPEADVFVFMDADGSDCPEEIPRLLDAIESGASLALAVRTGSGVERGSIASAARFGNWLSGGLIAIATGRRLRDLSPLKAIRAGTLREIAPRELTYGWTVEMLVTAAARGETIAEIETGYRRRLGGESKVSGNFAASVKAGYRILGVLGRVMVRQTRPTVAGAVAGALAATLALAAFCAWLLGQAPSGPSVLVSAWLLAPPLLLAGVLAGTAAGAAIRGARSGRYRR